MADVGAIFANVSSVTIPYGSRDLTLLTGWVSTPNVRATLDIVWSCIFTIGLSSWSILCLNMPARDEKFRHMFVRKLLWTGFVVIGPEAVLQLALAEYFEARKWTREYLAAGYQWTMTHSFYANMGGFRLQAPDEDIFPINAAQLKYLLDKQYIVMPEVTDKEIGDKNKADLFIRALTFGQILWFLISTVARAQQGLAITTIELTTLAFVFSAAFIFFFWLKKPMDIETFNVITTRHDIADIQKDAGLPDDYTWVMSPLEFVEPYKQWAWNLYWHYGITMGRRLYTKKASTVPKGKLVKRFADDIWPVPDLKGAPWSFLAHFGYASILLAGWNLDMPSYTELILWRIAAAFQIGLLFFLWISLPWVIAPRLIEISKRPGKAFDRWWGSDKSHGFVKPELRKKYSQATSIRFLSSKMEDARTLISDDSSWKISLRLLSSYMVVWILYGVTRIYIVAEDFASLRAMPITAYQTVDWTQYLPHI